MCAERPITYQYGPQGKGFRLKKVIDLKHALISGWIAAETGCSAGRLQRNFQQRRKRQFQFLEHLVLREGLGRAKWSSADLTAQTWAGQLVVVRLLQQSTSTTVVLRMG